MKIILTESELKRMVAEAVEATMGELNSTYDEWSQDEPKDDALMETIKRLVRESIEEGPWSDSAKAFGKAGLNFAKETGKKIGQGANWLGDKIQQGAEYLGDKAYEFRGGDRGEVERNFLYALQRSNIKYNQTLNDGPEKIEQLRKDYPEHWAYACKVSGVDPNSL